MRRGGHPIDTDLQRVNGIVDRGGHPQRGGQPGQVGATGGNVGRRLLHGVGQPRPLIPPRPGQLIGQPRRAGRPHLRGRRRQAVATQQRRRMPRRQSGRCRSGFPGPGRQGGQHRHRLIGMRQRPRGRDRGADRDTPDADGTRTCGVVQRAEIALDQTIRLRRRRHHHGPDLVQRAGKRPVDVVVVGSGPGQQHRRDTA